jgi:hypothetical protein
VTTQIQSNNKRIGTESKAAYRLRIQNEYVKGMETNRCGIKRIGCVSDAYPKRIRQRDGNESTAVSSVSVAYRLRIQSEYVKGMETTRRRYQAYQLRIGCVSKANTSKGWKRIDCGIKRIGCVSAAYPRCVVEAHDRQTDFGLTMTVVSAPWKPPMVL